MEEDDFEEQLRQEKLEETKKEGTYGTYTDADGTMFEWDAKKKAYFPKIDDDFIAKYQMNYGQSAEQESSKEGPSEGDTKTEEEKRKEYEQYCKDYYNYYYSNYNQADGENGEKQDGETENTTGEGGDNSSKGDNPEEGKYSYEDYCAYYNYYYGPNWSEGQEGEGEKKQDDEKKKDEAKDEKDDESKPGDKRKAKPEEGWFDHDSEKSTHIYISGLPLDITEEEYRELLNKYGLIMYDPRTRKPKLKLYRDENGQPKGDGVCCFIKQESVDLALNILDGSDIRGHKISVERAHFQMKGDYDPKKKRKKLSNKEKRKIKEKQQKLFDWRPENQEEGGRMKSDKMVVLKNMFDPKEFEENPMVINELRVDIRAEADKFGEVKKVTVYDRHEDGVVTVRYKEAEEADTCISNLNGRWFAKRRIIAQTWDGKTKFDVSETEAEREARLKKWETFLEKGDIAGATSVVTSSDPVVTSSESAVTSAESAVTSAETAVTAAESTSSNVTVPEEASATSSQSESVTDDCKSGQESLEASVTPSQSESVADDCKSGQESLEASVTPSQSESVADDCKSGQESLEASATPSQSESVADDSKSGQESSEESASREAEAFKETSS